MLERLYYRGVPLKKFLTDLYNEIAEDDVSNGAAAIAFYLMLAVFPAAMFLLTILPYLPIQHLKEAVFDFLGQALPANAAQLFIDVVEKLTSQRRGGLLSFGLVFAIWSASSGMYAIMQQLNTTYDVKEGRPFWKARGTALLLTLVYAVMIIGAFALIVLGGVIQTWVASLIGWSQPLLIFFATFRWVIIIALLLFALACIYYFGPDVEQKFRFITPGSIMAVIFLVCVSLIFRTYVTNFADYDATYGSIGAVIVLMLSLYIAGWVILLGSELNALLEHYSRSGKDKGEKEERPEPE
jgi:membrane protein